MRVLLATDGSEGAKAAAQWLATLPLPATTEVRVLAVAEIAWAALAVPPEAPLPVYDEAIVGAARIAADETRAVIASRWPAAEVRVLEGSARALIVQEASEWPADLVVVGARGLGALAGLLLGSVSTAVVHDAPCPVLVVKGRLRGLSTVMIATEGSEDSLAAVRLFASLPLEGTVTVRLIGVIEPPPLPRTAPAAISGSLQEAIDAMVAERRRAIEGGFAVAEAELRGKAARIERLTPVGPPADAIVEATKAAPVDLLVMGARGLGAIKRLLLGSVSERVLHHVECPVLVVKRAAR